MLIPLMNIDDVGIMYYKNADGNWIELKAEHKPLTPEEIEQEKAKAKKKLRTLTLFKLELMHLYDKYGITIDYDYDSVSVEFNDSYSNDYILYKIDCEIDYLKRTIGE